MISWSLISVVDIFNALVKEESKIETTLDKQKASGRTCRTKSLLLSMASFNLVFVSRILALISFASATLKSFSFEISAARPLRRAAFFCFSFNFSRMSMSGLSSTGADSAFSKLAIWFLVYLSSLINLRSACSSASMAHSSSV